MNETGRVFILSILSIDVPCRALSKLFGGDDKDALATAVEERDRELLAGVRSAVGVPKRQSELGARPKDDLDNLIDNLDALDL